MNENIGNNIKVLAKVIGIACLVGGGIAWLALYYIHVDSWRNEWALPVAWACLIVGVAGFISAWPLYGFGQMVEDVHIMRSQLSEDSRHMKDDLIKDVRAIKGGLLEKHQAETLFSDNKLPEL